MKSYQLRSPLPLCPPAPSHVLSLEPKALGEQEPREQHTPTPPP